MGSGGQEADDPFIQAEAKMKQLRLDDEQYLRKLNEADNIFRTSMNGKLNQADGLQNYYPVSNAFLTASRTQEGRTMD